MKVRLPKGWKFILSCEHGGHRIPSPWNQRLQIPKRALESHRGWDLGALRMAHYLKRHCPGPLVANEVSRLLVDFNRSPHHRELFSTYSRILSPEERRRVLSRYYLPYRKTITDFITASHRKRLRVLHVSVHSFTPVLREERRRADLGFLYDPSRHGERELVRSLRDRMAGSLPQFKLRRNYPYLGVADGLIPGLRREFSADRYLGLELEFNQALVVPWSKSALSLAQAWLAALQEWFSSL